MASTATVAALLVSSAGDLPAGQRVAMVATAVVLLAVGLGLLRVLHRRLADETASDEAASDEAASDEEAGNGSADEGSSGSASGAGTGPATTTAGPRPRPVPHRLVAEAEEAVRRAADARTAAAPIPPVVLVAAEAVAAARADGAPVGPADVAALVRWDRSASAVLARRVLALDRALRLTPTWSLAEVADVAADALLVEGFDTARRVDADDRVPADGGPRRNLDAVPLTLAHAAADAGEIWRDPHLGAASGAVARVTLATWPGRIGLLPGVVLVLSPSIGLGAPPAPGREPHAADLIRGVADAARRQASAEAAFAAAAADLARAFHRALPGPEALGLAGLAAAYPVLSAADLPARLGREPGDCRRLMAEAERAGLVRPLGPGSEHGQAWDVPVLLDAVVPVLLGTAAAPPPSTGAEGPTRA